MDQVCQTINQVKFFYVDYISSQKISQDVLQAIIWTNDG